MAIEVLYNSCCQVLSEALQATLNAYCSWQASDKKLGDAKFEAAAKPRHALDLGDDRQIYRPGEYARPHVSIYVVACFFNSQLSPLPPDNNLSRASSPNTLLITCPSIVQALLHASCFNPGIHDSYKLEMPH